MNDGLRGAGIHRVRSYQINCSTAEESREDARTAAGSARVAETPFNLIEETFRTGGSAAVFDLLLGRAREEKNARRLFDARILQVRHALGLPLIQTEPVLDITPEQRPVYEEAFREAAREAGQLCLASGDIPGAWPYFHAIGEHEPGGGCDRRVPGQRGCFAHHRNCFPGGRQPAQRLRADPGAPRTVQRHHLVSGQSRRHHPAAVSPYAGARALQRTGGLLSATIAANEGTAPASNRIADLIAGRDWLFEGMSSYADSTHLASILRFAPELDDAESLRMALEMAEYGQRLDAMFHFRGDPPFREYLSSTHAVYLRALLGEEVNAAVAHFRGKVDSGRRTPPRPRY